MCCFLYWGIATTPYMECNWRGDSFGFPQGKECRHNGLIKEGRAMLLRQSLSGEQGKRRQEGMDFPIRGLQF